MKKLLFTCLLAIISTMAFSQLNMTLLDEMNYNVNSNDIWGWVDPDDGTEYALVGLVNGLSIVDVSTPDDIVEVIQIPGPNSTWRDIKSWGNHVYVTNETSNGLLVVDMTDAPNNITWFEWTPDIPEIGGVLSSCHNLYIDEFGYCYLTGCNLNSGGIFAVDVFSDPGNPQYVAPVSTVYAHDVYARDNIVYASEIYAGALTLYDANDKFNTFETGSTQTPLLFTHNAWLNDAGDVAFTTDEKANAPVAAYDISDPTDIVELDQFLPIETLGEGVIPHNVHVWEDWLIISYYTDGGIIADASRPENIIEVGNWDTFFGGNGGFSGVWGAYPFLPSGIVLLTDINTGLYVCGADYVRACWLEGKVTNQVTGAPIFGAEVSINSSQANFATSDLVGEYKTGQAVAGDFEVTFSAIGFYPKTVSASLENGVLTILDVELEPFTTFDVSGQTILAEDASPAPGAVIFLDGDQDFTITSDVNGAFSLNDVTIGDYTVYAGGWGYLLEVIDNFTVDDNTGAVTIELSNGYEDDFAIDLGWEITGDAQTGLWERGEPLGTNFQGASANTDFDIGSDFGDQCYMTGNGGGSGGDDDVDNGTVTLTSPVMDLTGYGDPVITYHTWFFNAGGGGAPNDALDVILTNGIEEVLLESITTSASDWRPQSSFRVLDHIALTNDMRIIFETTDLPQSGHILEAAVDAFLLVDEANYPAFGATQTSGCLPHTVEFMDMSDSTMTYMWTFEGGTPATSTDANPVVEYSTSGIFNVTLEAISNTGNTYTIERPNYVNIGMSPTAAFNANVIGGDVNFTNSSMGDGTYSWEFGDGETSDEENPGHSYNAAGVYTVVLTMTNDCGTSTIEQEVEIIAVAPTASFSVNEMEGCTPFVVEFSDQSSGSPDTWEWSFIGGDPAISTDQNPTVTYNNPGIWAVELKVTNAAGESTFQETSLITVNPTATAAYDFTTNGPEVNFTNTSTNGVTYVWDFGDNTTSDEVDPFHTFPGIGEYEVTLSVTNDCGTVVYTETVIVDQATAVNYLDASAVNMTVAPNPFHDYFVLNYDINQSFDEAQLMVYNVFGAQLSNFSLTAQEGSVILGEKLNQSGIYYIRLMIDGKFGKAEKVVRQ